MYYGEFDPHLTRLLADTDKTAPELPGICEEPEVTPDDVRFALVSGAVVLVILSVILALT